MPSGGRAGCPRAVVGVVVVVMVGSGNRLWIEARRRVRSVSRRCRCSGGGKGLMANIVGHLGVGGSTGSATCSGSPNKLCRKRRAEASPAACSAICSGSPKCPCRKRRACSGSPNQLVVTGHRRTSDGIGLESWRSCQNRSRWERRVIRKTNCNGEKTQWGCRLSPLPSTEREIRTF